MEQLTIHEKKGANYFLLEVAGGINSYNYTEFEAKVYSQIKDTNLVIDFSEVNSIDSSGIGVLFGAYNDSIEYNHKFYLMRLSNEVKKAITATGFLDAFDIIQSVTEVI